MLHKTFTRLSVFAMVTLAALGASAHDGDGGQVTLTADSYKLWSNTPGSNNVIRISMRADSVYNPSQNCTDLDSYMVSSVIPEVARQRIYSTLLAAKLAGRPVRLYIDTNACEDKRPRVNNVTIE